MKFHEKLFSLRKQAGMTQNDLSEKLNVSRQAVSRWEMGTAKPDVENMVAMSDLFGVSLDYLLKDETNSVQQDVPAETPEQKKPAIIKWLRLALVLFACGIGMTVNGLYFGTPFSMALVPIGAVVAVFGLVAGVVLFVIFKKSE